MATIFTTISILLSVFAVFVVLGPCVALECYSCFQNDDNCADPFNTTQAATVECNDNYMCLTSQDKGNFTRACVPSEWCASSICSPEHCSQCCGEDLCNGGPLVPPGNISICYSCDHHVDTVTSAACVAEPFDPNGVGVSQKQCYGACTVFTFRQNGIIGVTRSCAEGTFPPGPCVSGCGTVGQTDYCRSCCEGDLCNDGPPPSLQQPSTQDVSLPSPTSQGPAFAPDAALMILGIAALYLAAG